MLSEVACHAAGSLAPGFVFGCGWFLCMVGWHLPFGAGVCDLEREKGIRWMPWHQEAMKDVARCEKPWGAASRR